MKQIEAFVDEVYHSVGGNEKEIEELKAEMKNHLLEAVYELKREGKSEKEAIDIAIKRFGGEKEMRSIVGQMFQSQKIFAKRVLYTAIGLLLLFLSIFGIIIAIENNNINERNQIYGQITGILEGGLTEVAEKEIQSLINADNHISAIEIFDVKGVQQGDNFPGLEEASIVYQYNQEIWSPEWRVVDLHTSGQGDANWFIYFTYRSIANIGVLSLFLGIAIFYPLFSIWAIINAYHQRRLNLGWIFVFSFLNVVGYLFYHFTKKSTIEHN
jgi:hypothetical protein